MINRAYSVSEYALKASFCKFSPFEYALFFQRIRSLSEYALLVFEYALFLNAPKQLDFLWEFGTQTYENDVMPMNTLTELI